MQREIDLKTKDTSYWKVQWEDACTMRLYFLSATENIPENELAFRKSSTVVLKVGEITDKYYTYSSWVEYKGGKLGLAHDTIWVKEKYIKPTKFTLASIFFSLFNV